MLYGFPVIWSQNQQLYAEFIEFYMFQNEPKELLMYDSTYIAEKIDSGCYNIIKANFVHAWFHNRNVEFIQEIGNIDAVYYLQDDADSTTLGVGVLHCDSMNIFLSQQKIDLLVPYIKPVGKIYPPDQLPDDKKSLPGFNWYDAIRPKNRHDIYKW
jgi:hypothetical protein